MVIVGGGPSGLACAIRLKQIAAERHRDVSVCLIATLMSLEARLRRWRPGIRYLLILKRLGSE